MKSILRCTGRLLAVLALGMNLGTVSAEEPPIRLAIVAEFGVSKSTSAQAISLGARIAAEEINAQGGVLGRKLEVIERDNRALPALFNRHLEELAQDNNVVAVMGGRFSPVVVEALGEVHRLGMPLLLPWSAADSIIDNGFQPNFAFRLSIRDSWALEAMLKDCAARGFRKVALLLPNTEWGRSSNSAADLALRNMGPRAPRIVSRSWYSWGDRSLIDKYQAALSAGAQAVVFVTNDREGVLLVRELQAQPQLKRLPIIAHWGITGGSFFEEAGPVLAQLDFKVVQTFSFIGSSNPRVARVLELAGRLGSSPDPRKLQSPVGVAHAYDLTHLLALGLKKAGTTDRIKLRSALEHLGAYEGLVTRLAQPFTPERHEALSSGQVFLARYGPDGALLREH